MMKAKKLRIGCMIMVMFGMMASGCGDNIRTDEEIVTPKADGVSDVQEKDIQGEGSPTEGKDGGGQEAGNASGSAIAEQVQAPERFTAELSGTHVSVHVDAPVTVPAGEGFKAWHVTSKPFEQADYDRVSSALLNGAPLWIRDYDAMEDSRGFTADEIRNRIEKIKENKAQAKAKGKSMINEEEAKERTYDESLAEWDALLETAPEEAVFTEVPAKVPMSDESKEYNANIENSCLTGYATDKSSGQEYWVYLDNGLSSDWRDINFHIIRNQEYCSGFPAGDVTDEEKNNSGFSVDDIRKNARELIGEMGFDDFGIQAEGYYAFLGDVNEEGEAATDRLGYDISFARLLEGIPVTYTAERGSTLENTDSIGWNYENLEVVYDKDGITGFYWSNPYEVEKTSDEYLFLLPFSEIQKIFEEMMIKKYEDFYKDSDAKADYEINEAKLGYMRVRENGTALEGAMVPVWDFFGTMTVLYKDGTGGETEYKYSMPYTSWLTINALDGTIIDRGMGY